MSMRVTVAVVVVGVGVGVGLAKSDPGLLTHSAIHRQGRPRRCYSWQQWLALQANAVHRLETGACRKGNLLGRTRGDERHK